MGNWLGDLAPWDAFVTWTFDRIVTAHGAMFWAKRHLRWLEKAAEQPVYGFVGSERGQTGGLLPLPRLFGNLKPTKFLSRQPLPPRPSRHNPFPSHPSPPRLPPHTPSAPPP